MGENERISRMLQALGEQPLKMNTGSIYSSADGHNVSANVSGVNVTSPAPEPAPHVSRREPLDMNTICMHVPANSNYEPGSVAFACVEAGANGAMGSAEDLDAQIIQKLSVLSIAVLAGIMEGPESQAAVKASVARYMLDRILGKPVQKQEIKTESQSVSLVIGNVLQRPELEFSPEQLSSMGVVVGE